MKRLLTSMLLLFVLAATTVCAGPPQLVNYQGRLTDSGGAPVNAAVPIVVRIYGQESGGVPAWDQTLGGVAVSNGLYGFQFGDGDLADVLTNSPCWLELVVDGETLVPRQQLVSVPYAFMAKCAETAETAANAATLGGASLAAISTPPGVVWPYAGTTAPDGFLLCFGQAVSRTTYSTLFAAIGIAYGAGDGTTTFNLPDLRGRFAAGKDDMGGTSANRLTNAVAGATLGAVGGAQVHTLTVAEMPTHTHNLAPAASDGNVVAGGSGGQPARLRMDSTDWRYYSYPESGSAGGGAAHNIVPPTIILNYIIKY